MTTATSPPTAAGAERKRRLGPLGTALDWRINRLQDEYLRETSIGRAQVAQLRRGLGKPAGSIPEIWETTIGAVPAELAGRGNEPSRAEQAAHAAITLYALHQQSLRTPAHIPGVSFGDAIRRLAAGDGPSREAVTRRFMAVATAQSIDEVLTHVRGLVAQLKKAEGLSPVQRGMDYAQFADDVADLLSPGRERNVRLRWGRDFYRTTSHVSGATNSLSTESTNEQRSQP